MPSNGGTRSRWERPGFRIASTVALALAGLAVLAGWLQIAGWPSELRYALGTVVLLAVGALMCVTWPDARPHQRPPPAGRWRVALQCLVAAGGAGLIATAAARTLPAVFSGPPDVSRGDMLVAIDHAVARFLSGGNPYSLYRIPWEVTLVYGPWLWMPYALPRVLAFDPRLLTLVAQSVVPAACVWAAVICIRRDRVLDAAMLLLLATGLALHPRILTFHAIGHTQVYWPLLLVFGWLVHAERWSSAAFVAGSLVAARTTMVSLLPVLVMYLFVRRELTVGRLAIMALGVGLPFLPFLAVDHRALVNGLVGSYMKTMKEFVWASTSWAQNTYGTTGLLLRHGLQAYVEIVQMVALLITYVLAWRAFKRGARVEPWLALALLVFSMTTLWPVHYIYFDVFVLVAAALASSVLAVPWAGWRLAGTVAMVLAATVTAVVLVAAVQTGAAFTIDVGTPGSEGFTGGGFGRDVAVVEGGRTAVWIEGQTARVRLPRAARSATAVHVVARAHPAPGAAAQRVTARLNGRALGLATLGPQWTELKFTAPRGAWYYGFNVLDLTFAYAADAAARDKDGRPRQLSAAIDSVRVGP
jgi:hypothetical protein